MGYVKQENQLPAQPVVYPIYTDKDLDEFRKFLNEFLVQHEVRNFKTRELSTVEIVDLDEAMVAFGAMLKKVYNNKVSYAVIIPAGEKDSWGNYKIFNPPIKYKLFEHKYRALKDRDSKRNFAQEKSIERYQGMMEGMDVKGFPA